MSKYPAQIDNQIPVVIDNSTPLSGTVFNQYRSSILAIEATLGINPGGQQSTVVARLNALENSINTSQGIKIGQDIGGTVISPLVIGLQGNPVSSNTPTANQSLIWNGISWSPGFAIANPDFGALDITTTGSITASSINIGSETISGEVSNIAALKALAKPNSLIKIYVRGYYSVGDGGDGNFYWDGASTATDNSGTIISANAGGNGRWIRVYNNTINSKWFGAKGDGITDDTLAIQNALSALSGGGNLLLSGNFILNKEIILSNKTNLIGDDSGNTTLNFSSGLSGDFANNSCIFSTGTIINLPSLSSNISKDDQSIVFSSTPVVSANDIIIIYNDIDYSFSTARNVYRSGEFARILSVSGNTVNLYNKLYGNYTAGANIHIYKLNSNSISIKNISIIGQSSSNIAGIKIQYGNNCIFDNILFTNVQYAGLYLDRCYDNNISNIKINDHSAAVGLNYGIVIGNSQKVIINNCSLLTTRHGIAMGGGDFVNSVPVREILVSNSIVGNNGIGQVVGIDCHGNSEEITIQNCFLPNGVDFGGDKIKIVGCTIYAGTSVGEAIHAGELLGFDITIQNNIIYANRAIDSSYGLVNIGYPGQADLSRQKSTCRIINNKIIHGNYNGISIYVLAINMTQSNVDVEVSNNYVEYTGNINSATYILIKALSGLSFKNVIAHNNFMKGAGLFIDGTDSEIIDIQNNTSVDSSYYGIANFNSTQSSSQRTNQNINILNNNVKKARFSGFAIIGIDKTFSILNIKNNISINCAQSSSGSSVTDSSFYMATALTAVFRNNTLGDNQSIHTQQDAWAANNITNLIEGENINIGTLSTVELIAITSELKEYTDRAQLKDAFGTSAPLTGTWTVGDRVWNRSPSSGSNAGWICTSSGSPGTWRTFGFISNNTSNNLLIDTLTLNNTPIQFTSSVISPTINQASVNTNSIIGQTLTIQSQNATGTTSTGGDLTLTSGSGTSIYGNINLQTGGSNKIVITQTGTSLFIPLIQFNAGQTSPTINQGDIATNSAIGQTLIVQSQNAIGTSSTGGNLNLTSGSGTSSAGNIFFQTGGVTRSVLTPTTFGLLISIINFNTAVAGPTINQADNTTNGATAQTFNIQAQNATGTTSTGGGIILTTGTGTTVAGNITLQTGGSNRLIITPTNITIQPSTTLTTTSTGNINLPNNTNARFNIEGAAVTSTVTAPNLTTLTNGSNADSLHTHSGVTSSQIVVSGLTTTGFTDGLFGYVSSANTMTKTDATSITSSRVFGANEGTSGSMTVGGIIENALFTTAGGSPSVGSPVYLSYAAEEGVAIGKLTSTKPTTAGLVVVEVGIVLDNSNYAGSKTCKILLQVKEPIQL